MIATASAHQHDVERAFGAGQARLVDGVCGGPEVPDLPVLRDAVEAACQELRCRVENEFTPGASADEAHAR